MTELIINKITRPKQYIYCVAMIAILTGICYALIPFVGYRVLGFIMLLGVSVLAMLFDVLPVLLAALLSALLWDFLFIPPHFTFQVGTAEDAVMLAMYFVVALVNAALTIKIRWVEKKARQQEEREHTVKLYNTMLNSLSHELRTPIAAIIGATDNLQHNGSKLSQQNRYDLVEEISKAGLRLNQQVENLLNMSRLESGFIQPKSDWCDINELVYDVVKQVKENEVQQQVHININPDIPFFKIDKGMLEQVLYNLLNNAIQYTPPKSRIDIVAACHADVLEISVEDNGSGFPEEEIRNVFNKFYRLNSSRTGGTGLGLSIVKGFTEAMHGDVILTNRATGGARFTISIQAETNYIKNLKHE